MLAVAATGTPVVLVLVAGRPIGSPAVHDAAAAVRAWRGCPASAAAAAIADVLGRCRQPRRQAPDHATRAAPGRSRSTTGTRCPAAGRTGRATTSTCRTSPLYPFGHGLSYSTFELERRARSTATIVAPATWSPCRSTVANIGHATADEVVQLYTPRPGGIDDPRRCSSCRASLARHARPGRGGAASRSTSPSRRSASPAATWSTSSRPATIELLVGTSADEVQAAGHVLVVGDGPHVVTRAMASTARSSPRDDHRCRSRHRKRGEFVTEFFEGVEPIRYAGPESDDPLTFRWYDADRVVLGRSMRDHLRFAICYWHSFTWNGFDIFGDGTLDRPWTAGRARPDRRRPSRRWPRRSSSCRSSPCRSGASTTGTSRRRARRSPSRPRTSTTWPSSPPATRSAPGSSCSGARPSCSPTSASWPARRPTPIPRCSPTRPARSPTA